MLNILNLILLLLAAVSLIIIGVQILKGKDITESFVNLCLLMIIFFLTIDK